DQRFCCYGCELASELAREASQDESRLKGLLSFCFLLSMAVMMLSLFLYAEDVYGATDSVAMARLRELYRLAAAILCTPVIALCGAPLLRRALFAIRAGRLSMDLLVVTGAFAAYGLSLASLLRGESRVYFDSATSALVLSTLGSYLEASARANASQILAPSLARPGTAVLALDQNSGQFAPLSTALIAPGARLRIALEQTMPVDAELVGAESEVNLAVLTGESTPRVLRPGDRIPAGAVPVSGSIECVALRSARESTLERLAELARQLRERSCAVQRWADRFATALVPAVWILAFGTLVFWTARGSLDRGVIIALAVVLAACPCTYGVTVPLTLWLALRRALEEGVLIRSASTLEELARVKTVAFDKTGTLTHTELSLDRVETLGGCSPDEAIALAASMEQGSPHPVARALVAAGKGKSVPLRARRFVPGEGVWAQLEDGGELFAGAPRDREGARDVSARVLLYRNRRLIARFFLRERLRAEAQAAIAELAAQKVRALMLTGDRQSEAVDVAAALGLSTRAGLTAEQKVAHLESLGNDVAMVGDGLNDAPALAKLAPSFAMGEGSELARGMSRVTLLRSDLRLVPWTLQLARRTLRVVHRSLVASTIYNLVFLGLAAAGAFRPVWAGLSMLTSSLLTLAIAQRATRLGGVPKTVGSR
ncbi:MAG TPA: heavy metal translocating P-type ATPase, partial [Myxococcaceae bacterium]|nr:heavy metal translocating P-type ATPase [Myxococcaceae bacterium]